MGELTAVASAKRAVRGDLSDGALYEKLVELESVVGERVRVANWTSLAWLSDMSSEELPGQMWYWVQRLKM